MMYVNAQATQQIAASGRKNLNIWEILMKLANLRKQRRDLSRLTPEQLADIGISARETQEEANRPVWDALENWAN